METKKSILIGTSTVPSVDAMDKIDQSTLMNIKGLAADLEPLGISVEVTGSKDDASGVSLAFLDFKYDTHGLEKMRTRRAGRKRRDIGPDSPLYDLTASEALNWLESHGIAEGMAALGGVSRAVYYRRKKYLNQLRDSNPDTKWW